MSPALAIASVTRALPMVRPIERAEKVFVLSTVANSLGGDGRSRLVIGVWGDGSVVWSDHRVRGGPPYRAGRAEPKKVAAFFAKVEADDPFKDPAIRKESGIIPDADYATLFLKSGNKTLDLSSVHELFENENPQVVVRSGGAMGREGVGRYALLKKDPPASLLFRLVWSDIRGGAAGLIPAESRRVRGRIVTDGENSAWAETIAPSGPGAIWPEDLPSFRSRYYRVDPYIAAANSLQVVGREKAVQALKALVVDQEHEEQVLVLCRMLFTPRPGRTFRRPDIGAPVFFGGTGETDWPLVPVELVDGVPFIIAELYRESDSPERPGEYLRYCLENCDWNTERFAPKTADGKQRALGKLLASPKWKERLRRRTVQAFTSQID